VSCTNGPVGSVGAAVGVTVGVDCASVALGTDVGKLVDVGVGVAEGVLVDVGVGVSVGGAAVAPVIGTMPPLLASGVAVGVGVAVGLAVGTQAALTRAMAANTVSHGR